MAKTLKEKCITNKFTSGILLILIFLCSVHVRSQVLIPQVGVTFSGSSLKSTDTSPHETDVSLRTGFVAGMGIEFPANQGFAFQSGLLFIQKGDKSDHIANDGSLTAIHKFNVLLEYIELPLHVRFSLNRNSSHQLYCRLGANVSYLIGGKYTLYFSYDHPSGGPPFQGSEDVEPVFDGMNFWIPKGDKDVNSRFDVGLYAGLGVLVKNKITVDLSYTYGVENVEFFYDAMASNRVIQLSLGMPFRLKHE